MVQYNKPDSLIEVFYPGVQWGDWNTGTASLTFPGGVMLSAPFYCPKSVWKKAHISICWLTGTHLCFSAY